MRKLLGLIAVIAILCAWTSPALADDPAFSAQPNIQPDPQGPTVGGSASASGGDAGPATVASSEPVTASSTNTTDPDGASSGSTSASGPGTTATVPTTASASEPDPSAPDGSTPTPTTSGPSVDADASQTSVSTSDSRVRANAVATITGSFAGSLAGVGSIEDPTYASTCSTAEAEPGVPTNASLGTSCAASPSSVSEDFSANDADGNGAAGAPSGSACLLADASAGPSPTTDFSTMCTAQGGATPSADASDGTERVNSAPSASAPTDSGARSSREAAAVLGLELGLGLPSTATEPASVSLLGATLAVAGLWLLRRTRRKN